MHDDFTFFGSFTFNGPGLRILRLVRSEKKREHKFLRGPAVLWIPGYVNNSTERHIPLWFSTQQDSHNFFLFSQIPTLEQLNGGDPVGGRQGLTPVPSGKRGIVAFFNHKYLLMD